MFEAVLEEIRRADTIIIHRHDNPDGDAIGSQVGMMHLLLDNFPDKKVRIVGDETRFFGFLAFQGMDNVEDTEYEEALAIILDTSAVQLISDDRYRLARRTVRIDHHIFISQIADVEVIDPSYESCAGLVTEFAIECGLTISSKAATALYTGIVTDSGRFRYDATSSGTFRRVSVLMEHDIDINYVYQRLYLTSINTVRLKAKFMLKIRFTGNKVAYYYTTKEELEELGITAHSAVRGYVNTMADLEGVGIWVAFAEKPDTGEVQCELRSSEININPIAVKYGGGGHAKASGATVPDKDTAMAMLQDLDRLLEKNP
ncbi:MAG: bifunctional oligoribonuclease/PAP phosphatase NrnA [Spirochaetales bacterium]|nr:bifunctional oligoribonuclease/PAP phosphatase NrnA [Spirochaetales bacterium]